MPIFLALLFGHKAYNVFKGTGKWGFKKSTRTSSDTHLLPAPKAESSLPGSGVLKYERLSEG
jgi:hypothetical protein